MTRHNAGMMFVDKLAEKISSNYGWRKNYDALIFKTDDLWLVKTKDVFMNESGRLLRGLPITSPALRAPSPNLGEGNRSLDNLFVAHDDLDIKLGEYKIQFGKGPKEHNGVKSIEGALGTKDFWRIRIGIENRSMTNVQSGEDYVLQKFTTEEKEILDRVLDEIVEANFGRKK